MVSKFLLLFPCLGFFHLSRIQQERIMRNTDLKTNEAVEILEYEKNNGGYWDGVKLFRQEIEKLVPIAEALCLGYSILFIFDNATSHSIYAENTLYTDKTIKNPVVNKLFFTMASILTK